MLRVHIYILHAYVATLHALHAKVILSPTDLPVVECLPRFKIKTEHLLQTYCNHL